MNVIKCLLMSHLISYFKLNRCDRENHVSLHCNIACSNKTYNVEKLANISVLDGLFFLKV